LIATWSGAFDPNNPNQDGSVAFFYLLEQLPACKSQLLGDLSPTSYFFGFGLCSTIQRVLNVLLLKITERKILTPRSSCTGTVGIVLVMVVSLSTAAFDSFQSAMVSTASNDLFRNKLNIWWVRGAGEFISLLNCCLSVFELRIWELHAKLHIACQLRPSAPVFPSTVQKEYMLTRWLVVVIIFPGKLISSRL
jgi:hypothetical protein